MDMAHVDQSIVGSFSRVRRWWGWGLLFVALTLALPIFAVPASQAHAALVAQPIINRNSGKCLDVVNASTADQANVQQFICRGTANQRWYVIPNIIPTTNAPDGTYRIVNMNSGKCLDVVNASIADQANVQQFTCHGTANQRWIIREIPGDPYSIDVFINVNSGKCLDVVNASTADQANVQQFTCHGGRNQQWFR